MKSGNKILFVLCAIAAVIGVIIYLEASAFQKSARIVQGTVVNSRLSTYEIRYTSSDGIERTHKGTQSSKGRKYRDGEIIKVFYSIDNPDKSRISDGVKGGKKVLFWVFILLLFNLFSAYQGRKKDKSENSFKTTGRKVEAQILKIDTDLTITVMEKHPYCIDCKWVDPMTGREYAHTIRYVWADPHTLLAGRNSLDVYIDRKDPEKYFMDIGFLGEVAR